MSTKPSTYSLPAHAGWKQYHTGYGRYRSYDVTLDGIKYSIDPVRSRDGKVHVGYKLTCFGYPGRSGHASIVMMGNVGEETPRVLVTLVKNPFFSHVVRAVRAARIVHEERNKPQ